MSLLNNSQPYAQNDFVDFRGRGLPGQLANGQSQTPNFVRTFISDAGVASFCGRLLAQGTAQDFADVTLPTDKSFTVRPLLNTDTTPSLYVGVAIRHFIGDLNFPDPEDGNILKAGYDEKSAVAVAPLHTGVEIMVTQRSTVGAVAYGDPVYVARDTNALDLFIGEFSNAALAGLELVPGAIWSMAQAATTDLNPIGQIKLL